MHQGCPVLGLSAFSSFLWKTSSCSLLTEGQCSNTYVFDAMYALCHTTKETIGANLTESDWSRRIGNCLKRCSNATQRWIVRKGTLFWQQKINVIENLRDHIIHRGSLVDCLLDSTLEKSYGQNCSSKISRRTRAIIIASVYMRSFLRRRLFFLITAL